MGGGRVQLGAGGRQAVVGAKTKNSEGVTQGCMGGLKWSNYKVI